MREIKAQHTSGETTENITIIEVLLKANDDIYVVFIDREGKIDGDEAEAFVVAEALHEISNG